jgi:protein TonB
MDYLMRDSGYGMRVLGCEELPFHDATLNTRHPTLTTRHPTLGTQPSRGYLAADARRQCIAWASSAALHLAVGGLSVCLSLLAVVDNVHLSGQRSVVSLQMSTWDASPSLPAPAPAPTMEFSQELTEAPAAFEAELLPDIKPRPVPIDRRTMAADIRRLDRGEEAVLETVAVQEVISAAASQPMDRARQQPSRRPTRVVSTSLPAAGAGRRHPAVAQLPTVQIGIETTPARPLYNPLPIYPSEAVRRGIDGRVVLRLTISDEGNVTKLEVASSSGHSILDQAALLAVSRWRFIAATWAGRPISWSATLPVRFRRS